MLAAVRKTQVLLFDKLLFTQRGVAKRSNWLFSLFIRSVYPKALCQRLLASRQLALEVFLQQRIYFSSCQGLLQYRKVG
jgi:hypothetical protein